MNPFSADRNSHSIATDHATRDALTSTIKPQKATLIMPPILALVSEGTAQRNRPGGATDTNMFKVASQVADSLVYVAGVGVNQSFPALRMATGWGAKAKSVQLADDTLKALRDLEDEPTIVGFGGSRGVAVVLEACSLLGLPVHSVCLFDAVYSFGLFWWQWLDRRLWPYEVPGNIAKALHIVALHEDTPGFSPVIFPDRDGLLQVSCPGDHTEILRGPEAERIALSWLASQGIPKRFDAPSNGWGEPLRDVSLPSYWSP